MEGCSWTDTQMFAPHASPTHASAHRDGRSPGAHRDQPPARLSRTVESEIIPRLMLALGRSAEPACAALLIEPLTGPGEVAAFATVLLEQDIDRVLRHVETCAPAAWRWRTSICACWPPPPGTWARCGWRTRSTSRWSPSRSAACSRWSAR
jgi:hypothetical protein